ncbi:erythromycin esterase-like protein [Cupriavidus gilardii J11]|uniref:Erythromycin esterase-like protein n=1 Tax=Cupriavidus gilardii J11 TaxID=936133 RepID=A0A562BA01_9BURK|nr:erythromycin esterase family protein [Cupriavidus gilardii]TWG81789.1 erythromycin esterase-like protein [Cupriavidus gilardii J11]
MSAGLHMPFSDTRLTESEVVESIAAAAERLPAPDDARFAAFVDRFAGCRAVLLGESTHGTAEFYDARAAVTRRLVEQHGFNIVAVEADWPDAASIDRYVRQLPAPEHQEPPFRRFPTWMWRNTSVESFVEWLRTHNAALPRERRAGFFGLDIYSMGSSIATVLGYLNRIDPSGAQAARERYGCLMPWRADPALYGRAVLTGRARDCEDEVTAQLQALLEKRLQYAARDHGAFFDAAQNAHLVTSAEQYYRLMYYGGPDSWNLRDTHMFETLTRLLDTHGPDARAVVWAHNSHIGNARATAMGRDHGEVNIGGLCRARFGHDVALIGLSTDSGTVAAASDWDGPMEVMNVVPARPDSYEALLHRTGIDRCVVDLREDVHPEARTLLSVSRQERFIGVIYRPDNEFASHYAFACLPQQFDALLWFDRTRAVQPLPTAIRRGVGDMYPFGL